MIKQGISRFRCSRGPGHGLFIRRGETLSYLPMPKSSIPNSKCSQIRANHSHLSYRRTSCASAY